jgi:hypothetical protein
MAVIVDNKSLYLVRYNGEPYCVMPSEEKAILAINSIANTEEKNGMMPNIELFRRSLHEGKEIRILSKSKGFLYDGKLETTLVLDIQPIHHLKLESQYASKIAEYKAGKR